MTTSPTLDTDYPGTEVPAALLAEGLDLVAELTAAAVPPAQAEARLNVMRARHPGVGMRLVRHREAADSSLQYSLLVRDALGGTISIAHAPERTLAWPLRGRHLNGERVVVRVDGVNLMMEQAVACLDFVWEQAGLADRLVDVCILKALHDAEPVELTDQQIQDAVDAFRRGKRLYTAAATHAWLDRQGLSEQNLAELADSQAVSAALKQRLVGDRLEPYLAERGCELDAVVVAELSFPTRAEAESVAGSLSDSAFWSAAEEALRRGAAAASMTTRTIYRADLPDETAAVLFAGEPGAVTAVLDGPEGRPAIYRILAHAPAADSTPALRDEAMRRLFAEEMAARRAAANVEWFWGNAGRSTTPGVDAMVHPTLLPPSAR